MLKRVLALALATALTGCGAHVATPQATNLLVNGSRFETLKAKGSVDPLVKKAVQDAAAQALQAIDALEDARLDPAQLSPALAQAMQAGQITPDQVKVMLLYSQLNTVFASLASLIDGGKDDYSKNLVAQLNAIGATVKKFETGRKQMSDQEALKALGDVVKALKKALETIAR